MAEQLPEKYADSAEQPKKGRQCGAPLNLTAAERVTARLGRLDGKHVRINSARRAPEGQKHRRDPRVVASIQDPEESLPLHEIAARCRSH